MRVRDPTMHFSVGTISLWEGMDEETVSLSLARNHPVIFSANMQRPAIDVYIFHEFHFSSILYDVEYSFACFLRVTNDFLYSFDFIKSPALFTIPSCLASMRQKPKEMF